MYVYMFTYEGSRQRSSAGERGVDAVAPSEAPPPSAPGCAPSSAPLRPISPLSPSPPPRPHLHHVVAPGVGLVGERRLPRVGGHEAREAGGVTVCFLCSAAERDRERERWAPTSAESSAAGALQQPPFSRPTGPAAGGAPIADDCASILPSTSSTGTWPQGIADLYLGHSSKVKRKSSQSAPAAFRQSRATSPRPGLVGEEEGARAGGGGDALR